MKKHLPASHLLPCTILMSCFALAIPATGADQTWVTTSNLTWSHPANWSNGTLSNGDNLIFGNASTSATSNNDIVGLSVNDITGLGAREMDATGNGFTLTGNISHSGATKRLNLQMDVELSSGSHKLYNDSTANLLSIGRNETASITGSGSIVKSGAGLVGVMGRNNTFTGGVTVNGGILRSGNGSLTGLGNGTVFGTGAVVVNGSGILDINRGSQVEVRSISGDGIITNYATSSSTSTLTVNNTSANTFSGNITDGANHTSAYLGLTKKGAGTLTLSGSANTLRGQVLVNEGTLLINGTNVHTTASSSGGFGSAADGKYKVASGATLGGTGYIAGNNTQSNSNLVLVESGGLLAPGDGGIGTLTLDGAAMTGTSPVLLKMNSGSEFSFDLSGNGGSADEIHFWSYGSGKFVLDSNTIDFSLVGSQVEGNYTVTLFRFYSDGGVTAMASGISSGLVVGTLGSGINSATIVYNTNTIDLQYNIIPEPGTAALFVVAGLAVILGIRRRSL